MAGGRVGQVLEFLCPTPAPPFYSIFSFDFIVRKSIGLLLKRQHCLELSWGKVGSQIFQVGAGVQVNPGPLWRMVYIEVFTKSETRCVEMLSSLFWEKYFMSFCLDCGSAFFLMRMLLVSVKTMLRCFILRNPEDFLFTLFPLLNKL